MVSGFVPSAVVVVGLVVDVLGAVVLPPDEVRVVASEAPPEVVLPPDVVDFALEVDDVLLAEVDFAPVVVEPPDEVDFVPVEVPEPLSAVVATAVGVSIMTSGITVTSAPFILLLMP